MMNHCWEYSPIEKSGGFHKKMLSIGLDFVDNAKNVSDT